MLLNFQNLIQGIFPLGIHLLIQHKSIKHQHPALFLEPEFSEEDKNTLTYITPLLFLQQKIYWASPLHPALLANTYLFSVNLTRS